MALKQDITFEGLKYNLDDRDRVAAEAARRSKLDTISAPASTITTLTADDSGKVILMAANACHVTLPAPEVGLTFKIIQAADYSSEVNLVILQTTDNSVFFVGGVPSATSDDGNLSDNNSNDTIEIGSDAKVGDMLELTCISSTQWQAFGFSADGTADGVLFADAPS